MQLIASPTGQEYNQRKDRTGAYWEDRYHATAVDTEGYLARCLIYIDLNMVRAGVVAHPIQWTACGYPEVQNPPKRSRIINLTARMELLGFSELSQLQHSRATWVEEALKANRRRESQWSGSLAVGSRTFVENAKACALDGPQQPGLRGTLGQASSVKAPTQGSHESQQQSDNGGERAVSLAQPEDLGLEPDVPKLGTNLPDWRVAPEDTGLRGWEAPEAGLSLEPHGPDSHSVTMAAAPQLESDQLAFEMAEVYWLSLLRDVPLTEFSEKPEGIVRCDKQESTVEDAVNDLHAMTYAANGFRDAAAKAAGIPSRPRQSDGNDLKDRIRAWNVFQNDPAKFAMRTGLDPAKTPASYGEKTLLLPMAFPEGSPMHPAYGAGHATVAGACVTVLKAFFDADAVFVKDTDPSPDKVKIISRAAYEANKTRFKPVAFVSSPNPASFGSKLNDVSTTLDEPLTVGGELDKLAANIAIARNMAGVHFYTDYIDSLTKGEEVAIQVLKEAMSAFPYYPDAVRPSMTVTKFLGGQERIPNA